MKSRLAAVILSLVATSTVEPMELRWKFEQGAWRVVGGK